MRKKIAVAALGLGLATAFAPLTPASAMCIDLSSVGGPCVSPCNPFGTVSHVNEVTPDGLPDVYLVCVA